MVLDLLRAEVRHARRARRGHRRWRTLKANFYAAADPVDRAVIAAQIAERLWLVASHLEASPLARSATDLPEPEQLRAQAVNWKATSDHLFREAGAQ